MPLRLGVIVYRIASTLAAIVLLCSLFDFAYTNAEDALLFSVIPYSMVALLIWGAGQSVYRFFERLERGAQSLMRPD